MSRAPRPPVGGPGRGGHGAAASPSRRDLLRLLNGPTWSGRVRRWALHAPARALAGAVPDAAIAIPARDERERIGACLDACAASIRASGLRVRTLVLVNGSRDDTAARALDWSRRRRLPVTVIEVDFDDALAHAGAARRLALELAAHGAPRTTALLATDADARPEPGWVGANVAHLDAGAALVCGRIAIEPREAVRLPARLDALGALEARWRRAALELEHLVDPDPWNPWPHHGGAHGASLALAAGTLADLGGVPLVPAGEDRALLRRARARGLRAVHADDVEVAVSARVRGRAKGGMADAIRRRIEERDPPCDEGVERVATLHARLLARAALRTAWTERARRLPTLCAALATARPDRPTPGRDALAPLVRIDAFDRAWDRIENDHLAPGRERLRFSELGGELAALETRLETARAAAAATRRACGAPSGPPGAASPGAAPSGTIAPLGRAGDPARRSPTRPPRTRAPRPRVARDAPVTGERP